MASSAEREAGFHACRNKAPVRTSSNGEVLDAAPEQIKQQRHENEQFRAAHGVKDRHDARERQPNSNQVEILIENYVSHDNR
jgi:hypothetical protein